MFLRCFKVVTEQGRKGGTADTEEERRKTRRRKGQSGVLVGETFLDTLRVPLAVLF